MQARQHTTPAPDIYSCQRETIEDTIIAQVEFYVGDLAFLVQKGAGWALFLVGDPADVETHAVLVKLNALDEYDISLTRCAPLGRPIKERETRWLTDIDCTELGRIFRDAAGYWEVASS